MGTVADSLFSALMSWVRALVSDLWAIFSSERTTILEFLGKNWIGIVLVLLAAGLAMDWLTWFVRWQPYRLWAQRLRRLLRIDPPNEEEEAGDIPRKAHAARMPEPAVSKREDSNEDWLPLKSPIPSEEDARSAIMQAQNVPDASLGAYPGMRYDHSRASEYARPVDESRLSAVHSEGPGAAVVEQRRAEIDAWQLQLKEEAQAQAERQRQEQALLLAQQVERQRQARQLAWQAEQRRRQQAQPTQQVQAQTAAQAQTRSAAQAQAQTAAQAQARPATQAQTQTAAQAQARPATQAQARPATQAQTQTAAQAQARPATQAQAQPTAQARTPAQTDAQAQYQRELEEYARKMEQYRRDLAEYERKKAEYDAQVAARRGAAQRRQPEPAPAPAPQTGGLRRRVLDAVRNLEPEESEVNAIPSLPPRVDVRDAYAPPAQPRRESKS